MFKKMLSIVLVVFVLGAFAGCSQTDNSTANKYNMQYATDAQQYCIFMNKQIDAYTNQLSANMIVAKNVADGEYPASDAVKTAEQSLRIMQSARGEVEVMIPPDKYADTRANTLTMMKNAENDLETYIDELGRDELQTDAIKSLVSIMQTDFTALTSEFNAYYE